MNTFKKYELTGECFLGDKGDIISVNWDSHDGAWWENTTAHRVGKCVNQDELKLMKEIHDERCGCHDCWEKEMENDPRKNWGMEKNLPKDYDGTFDNCPN